MFNAYFKQTVHESSSEYYRVRDVKIYYYLEDDSMSVVEPVVRNSGMPQGKLIKRQRLPKNDLGDFWHWKDLNVGTNITIYGKVFHTYDCDKFTAVSFQLLSGTASPIQFLCGHQFVCLFVVVRTVYSVSYRNANMHGLLRHY